MDIRFTACLFLGVSASVHAHPKKTFSFQETSSQEKTAQTLESYPDVTGPKEPKLIAAENKNGLREMTVKKDLWPYMLSFLTPNDQVSIASLNRFFFQSIATINAGFSVRGFLNAKSAQALCIKKSARLNLLPPHPCVLDSQKAAQFIKNNSYFHEGLMLCRALPQTTAVGFSLKSLRGLEGKDWQEDLAKSHVFVFTDGALLKKQIFKSLISQVVGCTFKLPIDDLDPWALKKIKKHHISVGVNISFSWMSLCFVNTQNHHHVFQQLFEIARTKALTEIHFQYNSLSGYAIEELFFHDLGPSIGYLQSLKEFSYWGVSLKAPSFLRLLNVLGQNAPELQILTLKKQSLDFDPAFSALISEAWHHLPCLKIFVFDKWTPHNLKSLHHLPPSIQWLEGATSDHFESRANIIKDILLILDRCISLSECDLGIWPHDKDSPPFFHDLMKGFEKHSKLRSLKCSVSSAQNLQPLTQTLQKLPFIQKVSLDFSDPFLFQKEFATPFFQSLQSQSCLKEIVFYLQNPQVFHDILLILPQKIKKAQFITPDSVYFRDVLNSFFPHNPEQWSDYEINHMPFFL
jgi:hypothetical protein